MGALAGLGATSAALATLVLAGGAVATPAVAATATPTPSATSTTLPPSRVILSVRADRPHLLGAKVTLVAFLKPAAAFGAVILYDGGTKLASATNYRGDWSYATDKLAPGPHHFTVYFTPTTASGQGPSQASADYTVNGRRPVTSCPSSAPPTSPPGGGGGGTHPSSTPSVTPTPTHSTRPTSPPPGSSSASPTRSAKPGRGHQSPGTKGSGSSQPVTSGSGSPRVSAGGGGGSLPFTGFDAVSLIAAAALLIFQGVAFLTVGRRRRQGRTGGGHLV